MNHPYFTEEFYGRRVPDVELFICDESQGYFPVVPVWNNTSKDGVSGNLRINNTKQFYHWTLRQVEDLKTKREYEFLLDSCSFVDSENFTVQLPVTITSLIGDFCTPVISSGTINLCSESAL